jgi:hypothetical protein
VRTAVMINTSVVIFIYFDFGYQDRINKDSIF